MFTAPGICSFAYCFGVARIDHVVVLPIFSRDLPREYRAAHVVNELQIILHCLDYSFFIGVNARAER
jgi:hypothetical protein